MEITAKFFERKPEIVGQDLLGKLLVRKEGDNYFLGIITETEAYLIDCLSK